MPLKFWDESFRAVVYLINQTPIKVIQYETPLEEVFRTKPNNFSLRVFGCACWPNLRPFNERKLQFRSKQCTFLGYSHQHKRFKCLDVATGCVYVFRDVIFDENVFPFASLHSNARARLQAEINLLPSHLVERFSADHDGVFAVDASASVGSSNNPIQESFNQVFQAQNCDQNEDRMYEILSNGEPGLSAKHQVDSGTAPGTARGESASNLVPDVAQGNLLSGAARIASPLSTVPRTVAQVCGSSGGSSAAL
jgi:hypothetical protein